MRNIIWILLLLTSGVALAQPAPPIFDVASIKPGGDTFSTRPQISAGRITWATQPAYLVGYAYGMNFSRVSGVGKNAGQVYVLEATFDAKASESDVRQMMRNLLSDRFKLKSHLNTVEAEGYAMSVSGCSGRCARPFGTARALPVYMTSNFALRAVPNPQPIWTLPGSALPYRTA